MDEIQIVHSWAIVVMGSRRRGGKTSSGNPTTTTGVAVGWRACCFCRSCWLLVVDLNFHTTQISVHLVHTPTRTSFVPAIIFANSFVKNEGLSTEQKGFDLLTFWRYSVVDYTS